MFTVDGSLAGLSAQKHGLIGLSLLRVGLGTTLFIHLVWDLSIVNALVGKDAPLDYSTYLATGAADPLALFRYSDSSAYVFSLYVALALVSLGYAIGLWPRVFSCLFAIAAYSIEQREFLATDAGTNLMVLIAFVLCFADTSQYFSIVPWRHRAILPVVSLVDTLAHNAARFLIQWQICMVYFWSAFYKLGGLEWRNGTALYYVMQVEHFSWIPWLSQALSSNQVVDNVLTYSTLLFQSAFPFLMWNPRFKPFLVTVALAIHGGIMMIMGLIGFSATVCLADVSLLSDEQFRSLGRWCTRWGATSKEASLIQTKAIGERP